jgi:hypothetical protein
MVPERFKHKSQFVKNNRQSMAEEEIGMRHIHPAIAAEVDRITTLLTDHGFAPPTQEAGPDAVLETYEGVIEHFMESRAKYHNAGMRVVPHPLCIIHDHHRIHGEDSAPVTKLVSRHMLMLRSTFNGSRSELCVPMAKQGEYIRDYYSVGDTAFSKDGIRLLPFSFQNEHPSRHIIFSVKSWCAVLLDPETTDVAYWEFIKDRVLLHLVLRGFWGYVIMLCPVLNSWGSVRGWYEEMVSVGLERIVCIKCDELSSR